MANEFDMNGFLLEDLVQGVGGIPGLAQTVKLASDPKNREAFVGTDGDIGEFLNKKTDALKSAVKKVTGETDEQVGVYINGLLSGDPDAMATLKKAQEVYAASQDLNKLIRSATSERLDLFAEDHNFDSVSDESKERYGVKNINAVYNAAKDNFDNKQTLMSLLEKYVAGPIAAKGQAMRRKADRKKWTEEMEKKIDTLVDAYLFDSPKDIQKLVKDAIKEKAAAVVKGLKSGGLKEMPFVYNLVLGRETEIMSAVYATKKDQMVEDCKESVEKYARDVGYIASK